MGTHVRTYWQEIKPSTHGNKKDDELCNGPVILANEFNKYFTEIASNILNTQTGLEQPEDYKPVEILRQFVISKLPHDVELSIPEVMMLEALSTIDTSKAAGIDLMSAKLLRISAPVLARHLTGIINTSVTTGVFPDLWKHMKLFPISKAGSSTGLNNFRLIFFLSILSKIIEKHVHGALYSFLNDFNLISFII